MPDDCSKYLVEEFDVTTSTKNQQFAWLKTITREYYLQHHEEVDAKASVIASAFFGDASGDWDKFKEERDKYFALESYSMNDEEASSVLRQSVSPDAFKAALECEKLQLAAAAGLHSWLESEGDSSVTVGFRWNVPYDRGPQKPSVTLEGGQVHGRKPDQLWDEHFRFKPGESHQVIVDRLGKQDIAIAVDLGGDSTSIRSVFIDYQDFSGRWRADSINDVPRHDLEDFTLNQDGRSVTAVIETAHEIPPTGRCRHELKGKAFDDGAVFILKRQCYGDPCVNTMRGLLYLQDGDLFWRIEGTDGRCGLATDYQERRRFIRV